MMTDATNRRNLNFLLLFGVFSFCGFKSFGDPVFSIYKSRFHNDSNPRDIVKAKNSIYVNNFKKLGTRDQKNGLYNNIQGNRLNDYWYPNYLLNGGYIEYGWYEDELKNNIERKWNLKSIDDSLEDQVVYMNDYRSRIHPQQDYVFYDHYHSLREEFKKDHHSFRKFLHNFRLHVSTGISGTYNMTKIGACFFKNNGKYFLMPLDQKPHANHAYQVGWFGDGYKKVPLAISSNKIDKLDKDEKIYTGMIYSFNCINLGVSYDFWNRLRFEVDFDLKGNHSRRLKRHYQKDQSTSSIHSKASPENPDEVLIPKATFFSSDLGVLVGTKIINTTFWSVLLNCQTFFTFFYKNFRIVEGSFIGGVFNTIPGFGVGLTVERHLSDYMSFFVRGMFKNIKFSWKNNWDHESKEVKKCRVEHNFSSLSLDFGINFTSSYIDKCDNSRGCKIKEVHIHNSTEYRGLNKWEYRSPYGKVIHSIK